MTDSSTSTDRKNQASNLFDRPGYLDGPLYRFSFLRRWFQPELWSHFHQNFVKVKNTELIEVSRALVKEPTEAQRCRIKTELWQNPEQTKKDVDEIKDWINNQPHLPKVTDDKFIENFLFGCKYDVEKAKTMMDRYFCARDQKRHFFENRDPSASDITQSFETVYSIPMPDLTPEGYRVIVLGLLDDDANKFSPLGLIRRNLMMVDLGLTLDPAIGVVDVTDCSKMSLRHLGKLSVSYLKDYLYCCLDAAPIRVKGIHLVHLPSFYGKFISIVKLCLPQKLRERVHIHDTIEGLHEHVPKNVLPVELGGKGPSVRDLNERWHLFLIAHKDWFLTEGSKKADLRLKQEAEASSYWFKIQNYFGRKVDDR